jgi:hypothetical protein
VTLESEGPNGDSGSMSSFAQARMPSSALIDKLLRNVVADSATVLDERTVEVFCARLRESALVLSQFSLTANPVDRAESFRYLLTMLAYSIDAGILNSDPLEPVFSAPYRLHLLDWGAASPDGVYRRAMVRDDRAYRVHGTLGNVNYFSMDFRQSTPATTILREDLDLDEEGNFEIFLGGEPHDNQWWPLHPGTTGLVTRELFDDWLGARRSHLRIECIDGQTAPRHEHRASRVAAEFDLVGDWVLEGAVRFWMDRSRDLAAKQENRFDSQLHRTETKLPVTTFGWWKLAPNEALVIELIDPEAAYWGLQLATSLWHTLDYANRLTTINPAQAHRDDDGVYRFVLAHADPGVYNWLDTTGLEQGVLILRLCGATKPVPPKCRLVEVAEIGATVSISKPCDADQRRVQLAERREGVARLLLD